MKTKKNGKAEILIAEDSPTQAEQLVHLLEEHGYAVTSTANGKEALAAASQRSPALIISDILMPELDGYGLSKAIKSDDKLKDIPVILVTTLSDSQDVIRGLECGADNFIRKPYDEHYLLSRIEYLLMNLELRKNQKMQIGVEIRLGDQKHFITAERQQILDLLISTYEQAVHINEELKAREQDLAHSNLVLNGLYRIAEGLNRATGEREVAELALERALELPGVQAGWIILREGESDFRLVAVRNLPPALAVPGALEGDCLCRRRLLAGEIDHVTNMMECERLAKGKGDTRGLRYHASVPLWLGDQILGLMNLVGMEEGAFSDDELKMLYSVGKQVAMALERARLHEHLEQLVVTRTAALRQSESWFRAVFNSQQDAVFVTTPDGLIINANAAVEKMFGYSVEELKGHSMALLQVDEQLYVEMVKRAQQSLARDSAIHFEHELKRKNGEIFPSEHTFSPLTSGTGELEGIVRVIRDITQRKEHEARIMRLNRVYAVLSGINSTIVRTRNRQELFDETCRIAVVHGQFRMAWIGLLDPDGNITVAAKAGFEEGYLDKINLAAKEDAPGCCALLVRVLREKTSAVCNDIAADRQMECWREEALQRGYHSMVAFPLQTGNSMTGLLLLYATEKDFFDAGEMKLLTEVAGDISFALDHLEKEERLNYLAYYDALTGLPNRILFSDRLNQILHTASKGGASVAVLVVDMERFRSINETFGRSAGDDLIRQVGERLAAANPDKGYLAHISADSFSVILPDFNNESKVVHFLEKHIIEPLHRTFEVGGNELRITAKAGIAVFPADGADADKLFRNAEAALEKAKTSGEKYLFYTPELNARVAEKLTLENKLHQALEQGQFVLHYQPKVNLKDGHISALEALIRWNNPELGMVPPGMFIPLLEETGMILDVGRWILGQAVADVLRWLESGLQPPRVAINVSAIQLRQKDFIDIMRKALNGDVNAARYIDLEITESLIMQDIEANILKLNTIREMGMEVAIDDFGTGYSSLSYIARLPVTLIKIDRAFIINMTNSPDDMSIVSVIISLAHSLDMKVVAEGVETREQANLLRLLKCDEIQGYLFSPAVSAEQIGLFLGEKKSLPM